MLLPECAVTGIIPVLKFAVLGPIWNLPGEDCGAKIGACKPALEGVITPDSNPGLLITFISSPGGTIGAGHCEKTILCEIRRAINKVNNFFILLVKKGY